MKKILLLLLIIPLVALLSCDKEHYNTRIVKKNSNIYYSYLGNKYNYRLAIMIKKGYAYQSNYYYSSDDEDIDTLLNMIKVFEYTEIEEDEYIDKLLVSEDVRNVYAFALNYGFDENGAIESNTFFISPTSIYMKCILNNEVTFYNCLNDETFYNDFFELEYNCFISKP